MTQTAELIKQLRQGSLSNDDYRWEAADRIEQLEAALLTGVCMLSEMGLDPREKCQMAYDYMSAALGNVHSIGHEDGLCPRERA